MGENIEAKDVQKTEYLDKNGLDMLWAKVKENTHNQVEVERNRAVAKENSIVDTKADKSALDDYVTDAALKALEQKVTANTTAISAKQDKPDDDNMFLQVKHDSVSGYFKRKGELKFTHDDNDSFYTSISPSGIYCWNENSSINFLRIASDGITLDGGRGTSGYAFTTNGKTARIPTKLSQLANDSNFITADTYDEDGYHLLENLKIGLENNGVLTINPLGIESTGGDGFNLDGTGITFYARGISDVPTAQGSFIDISRYALDSQVTELEQTVTANTTALKGKQDKGNYVVYSSKDNNGYTIDNTITMIGNGSTNKTKLGAGFMTVYYNDHVIKYSYEGIKSNKFNNCLVTSDGTFKPISDFVLKSVYDEKIAALEARIAALEAKHPEAAA